MDARKNSSIHSGRGGAFVCGAHAHELVINLRVTLFVNGDKKERWTALNAAMALTPLFQFVSIHHGGPGLASKKTSLRYRGGTRAFVKFLNGGLQIFNFKSRLSGEYKCRNVTYSTRDRY